MRKKTLALILVLTMCLAILSACSSGTADSSNAPTNAVSASVPAESSAAVSSADTADTDLVTGQGFETALASRIKYDLPIAEDGQVYTAFFTYSDEGNKDMGTTMKTWYEDVGITIEKYNVPNSVGSEKFNLMIASGDYYDILPVSASGLLGSVDTGVEDGVLFNFEPYIKEYMPNYYMLIHSNETYENFVYSDGGNVTNMATFYYTPYTADFGNQIRQDMLDAVGLSTPVTYDDWDKVFRAVKEKYNLTSTFSIAQSGVGRNNTWVGGYGIAGEVSLSPMMNVPIYLDGDTVSFGATKDEFKEYLKMMAKWYTDGILYKDFYSNTAWSPNQDIVNSSQCFCWQDDQKKIGEYQLSIADTNAKVYPVADPVTEAGSTRYYATENRIGESGGALSTTLLEKDWQTFLKCVDYSYAAESDLPLNYGTEGESYVINADGEPEFTDAVLNDAEGLSFNDALDAYISGGLLGGITYNQKTDSFYSEAELATKTIWDRSAGEVKPMPSEASLTTDESEAYTNIMNDVATYAGEMILKFIMGEKDIDAEWDTYVTTINDMGLDEAVGYQQAAYQRYLDK